ncbi:hypothetical protein NECAME_14828 [Necator americanus]|uniref:Uncharacterized protein n=1 Tax=Necator americanus TaxID=51031 RepID=W2SL70_NECAM|nr:hypothetical protein NECAME_14828 [Necator americanus]ETN70355.1 hypothetical protein NECAME_14828 [Necator americanus]
MADVSEPAADRVKCHTHSDDVKEIHGIYGRIYSAKIQLLKARDYPHRGIKAANYRNARLGAGPRTCRDGSTAHPMKREQPSCSVL